MLINQTFEIDSCDDVELGIKRTSKLEYRISYDDEKEMKAIVFVIGGFGVNANISFLDFDREYIAKNFDVVAVHVFYHCFCARKSIDQKYNPKLIPNQDDLERVNGILKNINLGHLLANEDNFEQIIPLIEQRAREIKQAGLVDESQKIELFCDFVPPNGDYQNYGIMAAIDHINALKDLAKRFPKFADLPKIYGGGSYGGYLSLLIAKIAPWYVDGVIDNSGPVLPNLHYIIGRAMGQAEFALECERLRILCFTHTLWNCYEDSKYYFCNKHYEIRSLLNSSHLKIQNVHKKDMVIISYQSKKDEQNPSIYKEKLCQFYELCGYDVSLYLIENENQVDGKFIKSLKHGMQISNRFLFAKELPNLLEKLEGKTYPLIDQSISYPCGNLIYTFKDNNGKFKLVMSK
ncbi:DUF2920 family protein [Campylobacter jejuni]|uniref:Carbonic anhydrase n=1 Tax=Campylobacter jejuni TaxID=197 RepID=A0A431FW87_CAMJU|nr:DUF2920 family protein [Campylobacter jejuni]RTJ97463.1 carbonic anhydrase [Campylobacter jejuni]